MTKALNLAFITIVGLVKIASTLQNGLGLTPPMGWNTWNRYYCDISQTVIYTNTD
jgi:alpha-galactosidase